MTTLAQLAGANQLRIELDQVNVALAALAAGQTPKIYVELIFQGISAMRFQPNISTAVLGTALTNRQTALVNQLAAMGITVS